MKKIYTGGTFDLFHWGHVELLKKAKELGHVTVALNTDEFIWEYKKKRPVMTYTERKAVLEACKYVDEVIENEGGKDSKPSILKVKPDVIIIGDDWKNKDYLGQLGIDQKFLDDNKIEILYVPYTQGVSSTQIKCRI